jgi:hypothetical protein
MGTIASGVAVANRYLHESVRYHTGELTARARWRSRGTWL